MSTIPEEVIKATYEEAIRQKLIGYNSATKRYRDGRVNVFFWIESDKKYGETAIERKNFWKKVLQQNDYTEFYKIWAKSQQQEITLEGQKFII